MCFSCGCVCVEEVDVVEELGHLQRHWSKTKGLLGISRPKRIL